MKPLVSVIIPTYKRTNIRKPLDSVLSQDYEEIEIVVVDDNAEFPEIRSFICDEIKSYGNERIKLLQNKRNMGGALSRNAGIKASEGKYIAFLDDDDWYIQGKIRKQVSLLESSDAGMVYCWCRGEDREGNVLWENKNSKEGNLLLEAMTECIANTSLIMCRREALESVDFFTDTPCKQDVLLELKLASQGYKFACVKEVLVVYGSADVDVERISNISERTIIGFRRVRDYARTKYDRLTSEEIAFVERDTAYKICELAYQLKDRSVFLEEYEVAVQNGLSLKRKLKLAMQRRGWR